MRGELRGPGRQLYGATGCNLAAALAALLTLAAAPADRTLDLTQPFATRSPWRLAITQGAPVADPIMDSGEQVPGAIRACLSRDGGRTCLPALRDALRLPDDDLYGEPHYLNRVAIVHPRPGQPALLIQLASLHSVNGNQRVATQLYRYNRATGGFRLVYERRVGRNNNEEVRYIDTGPLAGAVIAAEPTADAPFGFWITVSRLGLTGFTPVLRYRSATRYGDGNALAVIDSEMPGIQRRLGLWRPDQRLPAPPRCRQPHLVHDALWCETAN